MENSQPRTFVDFREGQQCNYRCPHPVSVTYPNKPRQCRRGLLVENIFSWLEIDHLFRVQQYGTNSIVIQDAVIR
jgi:hypothetical protein